MRLTEKQKRRLAEMARKALEERPDLSERYAPIGRRYLATVELLKKGEEKEWKERRSTR